MYARVDKALRRHPDPRRGDWSRAMGGPALPRRHALFYGPASRHCHPAVLVKRGQAPLALLAAPVSAPTGHDRCRETLVEAA